MATKGNFFLHETSILRCKPLQKALVEAALPRRDEAESAGALEYAAVRLAR